jgi:hypothetical protein
MNPPFWLDSNSLIEAKDRWYPESQVPKFWQFTAVEIEKGSILAPHAVYKELSAGNDFLAEWVKSRKHNLSIPPNNCVYLEFSKIADHVQARYKRNQYEEFLTGADPLDCCNCQMFRRNDYYGRVQESKKKIRIPTICDQFEVPFAETWAMVQHFDWKLG